MVKYEWIMLVFLGMTTISMFLDSRENVREEWGIKWKKAKRKFNNSTFVISIILIIILNIIVYGGLFSPQVQGDRVLGGILRKQNKRFTSSLEKANIAIIIVICSYMEVLIPPFWLVFIMAYLFFY